MYCISIAYPSAVMSTHAENRVDDRGVSNLQDDGNDEKLLFVYVENNIYVIFFDEKKWGTYLIEADGRHSNSALSRKFVKSLTLYLSTLNLNRLTQSSTQTLYDTPTLNGLGGPA